ncbi:hypothetical protein TNCV_4112681 [Trichonephila clavipes]|nr:hypothetical protein TNCV_4112681 [Trichonephila clavipes]
MITRPQIMLKGPPQTLATMVCPRADLCSAGIAVLFLQAHNDKYRLSALVIARGRPRLNLLDAESVTINKNFRLALRHPCGRGSLVVKVMDSCPECHKFEPSSAETRYVGQSCKLNMSRAETSSRWCGVKVRREEC